MSSAFTTAADDTFCDIFLNFRKELGMIFHENFLPADNSHEISCLICYFWKGGKIWNCRLLQIVGDALRVNVLLKQKINFSLHVNNIEQFDLVQHWLLQTLPNHTNSGLLVFLELAVCSIPSVRQWRFRVRAISSILFQVGIPNVVSGCILG